MSPNARTNNHMARNNFKIKTKAHAEQETSCVFLSKSRTLLAELLSAMLARWFIQVPGKLSFPGPQPNPLPGMCEDCHVVLLETQSLND